MSKDDIIRTLVFLAVAALIVLGFAMCGLDMPPGPALY